GCIKYEYNRELMDKHGINNAFNPKLSKIRAIMADAFEKEGVYSFISPEVEYRLVRAVETAAKELVKMMQSRSEERRVGKEGRDGRQREQRQTTSGLGW